MVDGVAPYDYDSAIDAGIVTHLLSEQVDAYIAECVTRLGGVSSYEPRPAPDREEFTDEVQADFPNLELLAERGRTLFTEPLPPGMSRDDYASDEEFGRAVLEASMDRTYTEDERELQEECRSEPGFSDVGDPYELYQDMTNDWFNELRDIDESDSVNDLRPDFRDCLTAGGMSSAPEMNEVTFWAAVDGELSYLPDDEARTHNRERGMLFAECGRDIYEMKERLRRDARDVFVEEHAEDIARLSDYLYGEGLLDAAGPV